MQSQFTILTTLFFLIHHSNNTKDKLNSNIIGYECILRLAYESYLRDLNFYIRKFIN